MTVPTRKSLLALPRPISRHPQCWSQISRIETEAQREGRPGQGHPVGLRMAEARSQVPVHCGLTVPPALTALGAVGIHSLNQGRSEVRVLIYTPPSCRQVH